MQVNESTCITIFEIAVKKREPIPQAIAMLLALMEVICPIGYYYAEAIDISVSVSQ